MHHAQHSHDAEMEAVDAISFAEWAMEQAEYAVIDAVLARAEADELTAAGTNA